MSLKAFHVVFIVVSTLCLAAFGVWGVQDYARTGSVESLAMLVTACAGAVGLVVYGRWFLRKWKRVSYL